MLGYMRNPTYTAAADLLNWLLLLGRLTTQPMTDETKQDNSHHDSGYKELFSYPELVQQLIEGFAPKQLAKLMDFSTLKQHNGHYITPLFEEKREDLVWSVEVNWKGSKVILYLYLLLDKFIGNEFGRTSVRPKDERQGGCSSISVQKR